MKKQLIVVSIMVSGLLMSACGLPLRVTEVRGSGELATETRRVTGFNKVELSGVGTLIIEQGDSESLEITAEDNIVEYLRSDVRSSNLHLGVDEFLNLRPTEDIIYRLSVKDLREIETSGLGDIEMEDLETDRLEIQISGSGTISIGDLSAERLSIDISGLGEIEIAGEVDDQNIEISGAGNYSAEDLASRTVQIDISGTGKAVLWVTDEMDVELSGAGSVQYYGNPILNTEISGLGEVKSLGEK